MPISASPSQIIEATLHGFNSLSGNVVNVFHFFPTFTVAPTLQEYGAGIFALIVTPILSVTSEDVTYDRIDVAQLNDEGIPVVGEPFVIPAGNGNGSLDADDQIPPFNAWTFKYVNAITGRRHGYKRFAGVTESNQVEGQPTSGALGSLNSIAANLGDDLLAYTIAGGLPDSPLALGTAIPIILHRVLHGDVLNPVEYSEISAVIFDHIGSQNTRKAGRGS